MVTCDSWQDLYMCRLHSDLVLITGALYVMVVLSAITILALFLWACGCVRLRFRHQPVYQYKADTDHITANTSSVYTNPSAVSVNMGYQSDEVDHAPATTRNTRPQANNKTAVANHREVRVQFQDEAFENKAVVPPATTRAASPPAYTTTTTTSKMANAGISSYRDGQKSPTSSGNGSAAAYAVSTAASKPGTSGYKPRVKSTSNSMV